MCSHMLISSLDSYSSLSVEDLFPCKCSADIISMQVLVKALIALTSIIKLVGLQPFQWWHLHFPIRIINAPEIESKRDRDWNVNDLKVSSNYRLLRYIYLHQIIVNQLNLYFGGYIINIVLRTKCQGCRGCLNMDPTDEAGFSDPRHGETTSRHRIIGICASDMLSRGSHHSW